MVTMPVAIATTPSMLTVVAIPVPRPINVRVPMVSRAIRVLAFAFIVLPLNSKMFGYRRRTDRYRRLP